MPKQRKDKTKGEEIKKSYNYPKNDESKEESEYSSLTETEDYIKRNNKKKKTKKSRKYKYKKRNWNDYLNETNIQDTDIFKGNLKKYSNIDEKKNNNKYTEIEIQEENQNNNNTNKNMINLEDKNDKNLLQYDKIYNIMLESNIMNISVESSDQQSDSQNEDTQNKSNSNMNNKVNGIVNNNINKTNEQTNLNIEEESKPKDSYNYVDTNSSEIPENQIKLIADDTILFNGKEFKKTTRLNKYIRKNKNDIIYYKCIFNRREEKFRTETKQRPFCKATIKCILNQNSKEKYKYILKKDHSDICKELPNHKIFKENITDQNNDKNNFINLCYDVMNSSTLYDRKLFKEEMKKIYNNHSYTFPLDNNLISNIISKWKNSSVNFTKYTCLKNQYDYNKNLILREFRTVNLEADNKKSILQLDYIIWCNNENLKRIRKSHHLYIDATFHHPPDYKQLLIIMYKDIITNLKIPAFYILMNGKKEIFYNIVFESIINIITDFRKIDIEINSVVSDSEKGLINTITKYFPNAQRISCFFHYTQDIVRNIKSYGLYKKEDKDVSNIIIKELSILPIRYNGDINVIIKTINKLKKEYPKYNNFITNYFMENKLNFFKDNSLNYNAIPEDCRTNNYLENYNGFIKSQLGKSRIVNWVNFIHFIKKESERSIEKLFSNNITNCNSKIDTNFLENNIITDKDKAYTYNEKNDIENILDKEIDIKNRIENLKEGENFIERIINSTIGIYNVGNTCFINCVIQILIHSKIFMNRFIAEKNTFLNNIFSISFRLFNIAEYMNNNSEKKDNIIDISNFIYLFKLKHPIFGNLQNDAQEFCRILLEDLSNELNEVKEKLLYKELVYNINSSKIDQNNIFHNNFCQRENSIISNIFYSQIISIFICDCKCETYAFQKIMDLPLLFPEDNKNIFKIENLLEYYFKEEKIQFGD